MHNQTYFILIYIQFRKKRGRRNDKWESKVIKKYAKLLR